LRALQDLCKDDTIKRKFYKKMFFVEIFFCFATFVVQNLATHKTEKQRGKNSLTTRIALPQDLIWYIA
jgi:hypothetical protein